MIKFASTFLQIRASTFNDIDLTSSTSVAILKYWVAPVDWVKERNPTPISLINFVEFPWSTARLIAHAEVFAERPNLRT